ncbi:ABC transporter permease [candidate division KSB1 bacterium]
MSSAKKLVRTFRANKTALIGGLTALVLAGAALLALWLSPHDPLSHNIIHRLAAPDNLHLLGTDEYGRDVLSRILWGIRISLIVGILSVALGMVLGTTLGLVAGYRGGITGSLIMRAVDVLLSFPTLLTGIMVVAILGSGMDRLIITIGVVFTPRFARLAYGPSLAVREMEFVDAARVVGAGHFRIITRHILPNIRDDILVAATLWLGTAIMIEAGLSFLGLGISPPTPTLGNMIRSGVDRLTLAPWLTIAPGLAVMIAVLSFNMIGDGLRDITDPKLRN